MCQTISNQNVQRFSSRSAWAIALLALLAGAMVAQAQPQASVPKLAGSLAERAAQEYRLRSAYPESSRALSRGELDPVIAQREPAPHSLPAQASAGGLLLTTWPAEVSFESPEPVVRYRSIQGARGGASEHPRGSRRAELVVVGEVVGQAGDPVGKILFFDDGRGADRQAGDDTFTGTFRMPAERVPELAESFLVKIEAAGPEGTARIAGGFLYSHPWAHLTGRFRDRVEGGNLVISAEVEVSREGRFHLAGTLYSDAGEPLGWAQAAAQLTAGTQWVDLAYFGRMFHERGVGGPYHLGTLSLATTSGMPNALNRLVEGVYTTSAYDLESFRSEPFGDPGLLDAAQRLEVEAALSRLRVGSEQ